ncbi:MAG: hypothetical protein WD795_05215 [Woeseia sp.]
MGSYKLAISSLKKDVFVIFAEDGLEFGFVSDQTNGVYCRKTILILKATANVIAPIVFV